MQREMNNSGIIAIVVAILSLEVGLNTLIKASIRKGMSNYVFVVYSHVVALFFLLPLTFIRHGIAPFPKLTSPIVSKIFLLAILSFGTQICNYIGIGYSSPTLSSAISNLTPAFTFLIAIFTRMEKLNLKAHSSQAKWIGTVISIAGAFIINLYRGPQIISHLTNSNTGIVNDHLLHPALSNWIFGGFLFAVSAFLHALVYIVMSWILKDYPEELMVTFVATTFVTIQAFIVALIAENDPNAWKLRLDLELVTICYSGTVVLCLRSVGYTWAVRLKGPVFITSFKPLEIVVALVLGVTFLGDTVYLGSVVGAGIISVGFYSVMYGKSKELETINHEEESEIVSPLLQTQKMEA